MAADAVQIELREHDRRISGLHRTVGGLSTEVGDHKTEIAVIHTELRGAREDIAEMKKDFSGQLTWVRRGLWAAAATFTMFVVALATLIVQLVGHG